MNALENKPKILIHAYGNAGRGDDALGFAFLEMCRPWLAQEYAQHVTAGHGFQLNMEDSFTMSEYDIVLFVDATKNNVADFTFSPVKPLRSNPFTTHTMTPASLLYHCNDLYGRKPETFLLQIKGYEWEMKEGLSERAEKNLWTAFQFFRNQLQDWVELSKAHVEEHLH